MTPAGETTPSRLNQMPGWLIGQLSLHAYRILADRLANVGFRPYDYRLLAALEEVGQSSQMTLSRRTGIDRSDVVVSLNHLADLDLVRRSPDPDDRRKNVVSLTKSGKRQLRRLDKLVNDVQDEVVAPLTVAERETLVRLLRELLQYHSGNIETPAAPDQ